MLMKVVPEMKSSSLNARSEERMKLTSEHKVSHTLAAENPSRDFEFS